LSTPSGMRPIAQTLVPDADVVHCHEFRTVENLLVTPIAVEQHKPLVLSPHGTMALDTGRGKIKTGWDQLLGPTVARRFNLVIGLTQNEVETVKVVWKHFGRRKMKARFSVIPNGIDPTEFAHLKGGSKFREKHGLGSGPVCLFMGRLHARKGVDVLVPAFQQAAAHIPAARLLIVGPDEGMLTTLQTLADERTVFTGYLGGDERLAAFAAADMLALPATGEGLSMAVLEAMGAGLPVILSPGCNLPEAAEWGAGLEVEPQVEALAEALYTLLSDRRLRAEMSAAARQLVHERFTWDAVAEQLERVYEKLLPKE
jgi:glycosyltransferase involved in cell wall biosynthesis